MLRSFSKALPAKLLSGLCVGSILLFGACSPAASEDRAQDQEGLTFHQAEDPAMLEAIAKAQASLPVFWAAMESANDDYSEFVIKYGMKTDDGNIEHIWVNSLSRDGDTISGKLGNDPHYVASASIGDDVSFTMSEVSDWTFIDLNKMRGHYTTRVLMKNWPKNQADEFLSVLSETP